MKLPRLSLISSSLSIIIIITSRADAFVVPVDYADLDLFQELPSLGQLLFVASQLMISPTTAGADRPLLFPPRSFPSSLLPAGRNAKDQQQALIYDYESTPPAKTIHLTEQEQQLFHLVKDFRNAQCPDTTIRVAGGWVRDKLLQKDHVHDIDFVTSNLSGKEFATRFHDYWMQQQQQQEQGDLLVAADTIASPLQNKDSASSQHLETATLKIGEFVIDVCHLRFDRYNKESRVPETTTMASPVEDAWRRDLTINSLFYNIHSNQIEDWTERGLEDLLLRRVATPKAPLATLLQDPLRILRAIRFAAQFSFTMDPALIQAARDPQVQVSLETKLSNTRKAKETDAVFRTCNPSLGVELLLETNLLQLIFGCNDNVADSNIIWRDGLKVLSTTQRLVSKLFTKLEDWDESSRRYLWYAAFLHPFFKREELKRSLAPPPPTATAATTSQSNSGRQVRRQDSVLFSLLNTRLKLSKGEVQSIESIIKGTDGIQSLLQLQEHEQEDHIIEGRDFQDSIRWSYYQTLKQIGPLWKESLLLWLVLSCQEAHKQGNGKPLSAQEAVDQYVQLQNRIEAVGLNSETIHKIQPMLNGSQVQKILPRLPKGVAFKSIMNAQEQWQVSNSNAWTSTEYLNIEQQRQDLIEHLKLAFPEYT
jgi:tRNA nucleotidyltransferase/poly(A) polymerase